MQRRGARLDHARDRTAQPRPERHGLPPGDARRCRPAVKPSRVGTARASDPQKARAKAEAGIKVITTPDLRWKRPDIKSISLLPNVLAKQAARVRGAGEAWLVAENGTISEGAASNAWIIDTAGTVITHPVDRTILKGVTRTTLLEVLASLGLTLEERAFSVEEAYAAREAFVTGRLGQPQHRLVVRDGRPGPIVTDLRLRFHDVARRSEPIFTDLPR